MLDELQRAAFAYFCANANSANTLALDTSREGSPGALVFASAIGENCAPVRPLICDGLDCVDASRNAASADVISVARSRVTVRVGRTNEEWMVAMSTAARVSGGSPPPKRRTPR